MDDTIGSARPIQIDISSGTIARLLVWTFAVWAAVTLWREISLCLLAMLLALALDPVVQWVESRGYKRGAVVAGLGASGLVIALTAALLAAPPVMQQINHLITDYGQREARLKASLKGWHPVVQKAVQQVLAMPSSPDSAQLVKKPVEWGKLLLYAIGSLVWVYVVTLYLLVDGRHAYAWLLSYLPRAERDKAAETVPETTAVVGAYMRGQLLTSVLCGGAVLAVLSLLGVPGAVPLGALAFVADVLPVIGWFVYAVPSVLAAASVSGATAGWTLAFLVVYHAVESYLIVPRVYGDKLRLSNLVVLVAVMVGAVLDGVLGAVLILPLVAVYPIFERIWGPSYLRDEVVEDHAALAAAEDREEEEAVQAVIQGQEPAAPAR